MFITTEGIKQAITNAPAIDLVEIALHSAGTLHVVYPEAVELKGDVLTIKLKECK